MANGIESQGPQGRERRVLQDASPQDIEFLFEAGIETYGQLKEYSANPEALYNYLDNVKTRRGLRVVLPSFDAVRRWLIQADGESPGTVIIKPPP